MCFARSRHESAHIRRRTAHSRQNFAHSRHGTARSRHKSAHRPPQLPSIEQKKSLVTFSGLKRFYLALYPAIFTGSFGDE